MNKIIHQFAPHAILMLCCDVFHRHV